MEVSAAFFVVKTFERMCREYSADFEEYRQNYSDVTFDPIPLEKMPGKYRGLARQPLEPWVEDLRGYLGLEGPPEHELVASLFMMELKKSGKAKGPFIHKLDDARKVFGMLQAPVEREIIWARRVDRADAPPSGAVLLGYDPLDFRGGFESLIANVAFFRWNRFSDPGGTRAKIHYARLNEWGLFNEPIHVQEYVDSFPRLPDHKRPPHIAEVWSVK